MCQNKPKEAKCMPKQSQNDLLQLSDVQPITMYAHSSVQPMILCDVISRRRSPSRSGNHTGIIYDSSFRDGEVLFCLNKLLSAQWNCLLTLSNSVQDKCWHGNNMIIITESDFPYLVKYDNKFTKFCVLFRGGN